MKGLLNARIARQSVKRISIEIGISIEVLFISFTTERAFGTMNKREGTGVRNKLTKSMRYNEPVDMIYMSSGGVVSKRRIKVLCINEETFQAYCHLRMAKRTFRIDNVLALVPVYEKESMVI